MRKQAYPAPIVRLSDFVENKLMSYSGITIDGAVEPVYIYTLQAYIDEAYEIMVFAGGQTIRVNGWLNFGNGKRLPIIKAQRNNKTDRFVMYCLLAKSEDVFFEYARPRLVEKE